jgi:hypothetical protein
MAIEYRANLSSAYFPLISRFHGRTVIVAGQDQNFNRQLQSSADLDKDIGIPQIFYCHNVMPTGNGFQSIGYEQRISSVDGTDKGIYQEILLRDDSMGKKGYFSVANGAIHVVLNETFGYALSVTTYWDGAANQPLPALASRQLTAAHVNGITYLYIQEWGCLVWNFTLNRFELTTLTSLVATEIIGLTESNGYLIAFSVNAVAWSSLITPTDFTPSLTTGAGGGNVEGIKGNITCGAPTSNGFILYTEVNAVSVLYTGNSLYPFQFSECIGAGGVSSLERVTYDADSGYNYAYTSNGFQVLKSKSAETLFPDITDFLAGQYFEDFDDATLAFSYNTLTSPLQKKFTFVANRYLVISYGITELTHAIVYDSVQKRFGKLKFTHVDCFQYELISAATNDIPRKSIAFLKSDGSVYLMNFALPFTSRNGVILLGKYQYVRTRHMQLQGVDVEGPTTGGAFSIYDFPSYDGKNFSTPILGVQMDTGADYGSYGFGSPDALNHSILCKGCWNLTSMVLLFNITGRM